MVGIIYLLFGVLFGYGVHAVQADVGKTPQQRMWGFLVGLIGWPIVLGTAAALILNAYPPKKE